MYEVTWMNYEYDWEIEQQQQCFTSEQFNKFEDAIRKYNEMKNDIEVEHVRIVVILDEFSR